MSWEPDVRFVPAGSGTLLPGHCRFPAGFGTSIRRNEPIREMERNIFWSFMSGAGKNEEFGKIQGIRENTRN